MNSEAVNLDGLPVDILAIIFMYLSFTEKLNLTQVCNSLNKLISGSWNILMKTDLIAINLLSRNENLEPNLGFHSRDRNLDGLQIQGFPDYKYCHDSQPRARNLLQIIEKFGCNIKKFHMVKGQLEYNFLVKILNLMPNLEEIELHGAVWEHEKSTKQKVNYFYKEQSYQIGQRPSAMYRIFSSLSSSWSWLSTNFINFPKIQPITWSNLKSIKLNLYSGKSLKIFINSKNVEKLSINFGWSLIFTVSWRLGYELRIIEHKKEREFIYKSQRKILDNFLSSRQKLSSLELSCFRSLSILSDDVAKSLSIQLERLVIKQLYNEASLLDILRSQKECLKSLTIVDTEPEFPDSYYQMSPNSSYLQDIDNVFSIYKKIFPMLSEFQQLSTLEISLHYYTSDFEKIFPLSLTPNITSISLSLQWGLSNIHLESLITSITEKCPNLKTFNYVRFECPGELPPSIWPVFNNFQCLEVFQTDLMFASKFFENFCLPTLKHLVVPNTKFSQKDAKVYENFIKKHKKLEVLRIGEINIELSKFTLKNLENLRFFEYQLKFLKNPIINLMSQNYDDREILDLAEMYLIARDTGFKIETAKNDGYRKSRKLDLMNPDVAGSFWYEVNWQHENIKCIAKRGNQSGLM